MVDELSLEKLRKYKKYLERDLEECVGNRINDFTKATGWGVKDIWVRMVESTAYGDDKRNYLLGSVKVDLDEI